MADTPMRIVGSKRLKSRKSIGFKSSNKANLPTSRMGTNLPKSRMGTNLPISKPETDLLTHPPERVGEPSKWDPRMRYRQRGMPFKFSDD